MNTKLIIMSILKTKNAQIHNKIQEISVQLTFRNSNAPSKKFVKGWETDNNCCSKIKIDTAINNADVEDVQNDALLKIKPKNWGKNISNSGKKICEIIKHKWMK